MKTTFFKYALSTFLLTGIAAHGYAQKLPDVQGAAVPAPAGIKVDGKNTEWGDGFKALNKRTSLYYTLANDDKNLYLTVRTTDPTTSAKIFAGGITFGVNPDGKKKDKESMTLTYPVISRDAMRMGGGRGPGGGGGNMRREMGMTMGSRGADNPKQRDSMMAARQKTQLAAIKEIQIRGFKTTADSVVSIYNEYGIKAVGSIDKDNAYFYEMAIPLAALGLDQGTPAPFAYQIKLNGIQMQGLDGGGFGGGRGGFGGGAGPRGGGSGIDFQALMSPTDFWGTYTLIKK